MVIPYHISQGNRIMNDSILSSEHVIAAIEPESTSLLLLWIPALTLNYDAITRPHFRAFVDISHDYPLVS